MANTHLDINLTSDEKIILNITPKITIKNANIEISEYDEDTKILKLDDGKFSFSCSGKLESKALEGKAFTFPCRLITILSIGDLPGDTSQKSEYSISMMMKIDSALNFEIEKTSGKSTITLDMIEAGIVDFFNEVLYKITDTSTLPKIKVSFEIELPFYPENERIAISGYEYFLPKFFSISVQPEVPLGNNKIGDKITFEVIKNIPTPAGYTCRFLIWEDPNIGFKEDEWSIVPFRKDCRTLQNKNNQTLSFMLGYNPFTQKFYYPIDSVRKSERKINETLAYNDLKDKIYNYFSYAIQFVQTDTINTENEKAVTLYHSQDAFQIRYSNIPKIANLEITGINYKNENNDYEINVNVSIENFSPDLEGFPIGLYTIAIKEDGTPIIASYLTSKILKKESPISNNHTFEGTIQLSKLTALYRTKIGMTLPRTDMALTIADFIRHDNTTEMMEIKNTPPAHPEKYFILKNDKIDITSYINEDQPLRMIDNDDSTISYRLKTGWFAACPDHIKLSLFCKYYYADPPKEIFSKTFKLYQAVNVLTEDYELEKIKQLEKINKISITIAKLSLNDYPPPTDKFSIDGTQFKIEVYHLDAPTKDNIQKCYCNCSFI